MVRKIAIVATIGLTTGGCRLTEDQRAGAWINLPPAPLDIALLTEADSSESPVEVQMASRPEAVEILERMQYLKLDDEALRRFVGEGNLTESDYYLLRGVRLRELDGGFTVYQKDGVTLVSFRARGASSKLERFPVVSRLANVPSTVHVEASSDL